MTSFMLTLDLWAIWSSNRRPNSGDKSLINGILHTGISCLVAQTTFSFSFISRFDTFSTKSIFFFGLEQMVLSLLIICVLKGNVD